MVSRDFQDIASIQEVECSGGGLDSDVKLISLQMVKLPQTEVLASLNVYTDNCMTFNEFSSCKIHPANVHKSYLRILVHDLEEWERREYGCTANTINPLGNSIYKNWKTLLVRHSKSVKLICRCLDDDDDDDWHQRSHFCSVNANRLFSLQSVLKAWVLLFCYVCVS